MPRKTQSQRDEEWRALDARALRELLDRITGVGTWDEARELAKRAPGTDSPGRRPYANFGCLLIHLGVPADATADELVAYIGMVERIMLTGALGGGVGDELLGKLRQALM